MDQTRSSFYLRLIEASDHRSFLRCWMTEGGRNGSAITFGEASRRFGFSSRSFLSDVLQGKKSLSLRSLHAIRRGLSHLPDVVVRCFVFLAYQDEEGLRPQSMTKAKAQSVLVKLRQRGRRLFQEENPQRLQQEIDTLVTQMAFHLCFAALDVGESGESIQGVCAKTRLSLDVVTSMLEQMSKAGFVAPVGSDVSGVTHYRAMDAHRVVEQMASPGAFHAFVVNWLSHVLRQAAAEPPRAEDLYNVSTFSVRTKDRPLFRRRLIDAIDSLVEEFEASPGEEIVSLSVVYRGH